MKPDVSQIIYALERQRDALDAHAERLGRELDYSAEFPAADADRMREAIEILKTAMSAQEVSEACLPILQLVAASPCRTASADVACNVAGADTEKLRAAIQRMAACENIYTARAIASVALHGLHEATDVERQLAPALDGGLRLAVETTRDDLGAAGSHKFNTRKFNTRKCDYSGTPPFVNAAWKEDATMCKWCAGTGHPHADESYGMCRCPSLRANV